MTKFAVVCLILSVGFALSSGAPKPNVMKGSEMEATLNTQVRVVRQVPGMDQASQMASQAGSMPGFSQMSGAMSQASSMGEMAPNPADMAGGMPSSFSG